MTASIPRKRRVGETITYEHPQTHVQGSGTVTRLWPEYNAVVVLTPDGERVVHEANIIPPKRDFSAVPTVTLKMVAAHYRKILFFAEWVTDADAEIKRREAEIDQDERQNLPYMHQTVRLSTGYLFYGTGA